MDILPHEKQIEEYVKAIEHLKKQNKDSALFEGEIKELEAKLETLRREIYSNLTPWERVTICRHPSRPHSIDIIKNVCETFEELSGDRNFADDQAIIGGLARINGVKCVIMGQEKGSDTESRVKRNFGMLNPEGFRKAMRLMEMAEKFHLPIITLLDTPGAYPGLEAEERGQGWAIAENLLKMSRLRTPIITIVIGEGCSGGALGMGVGDVIAMLEHAYYSVISPEGCASILWKDAAKNQEAAETLKLTAEDLLNLDVIDTIIKEPLGGAHRDPTTMYGTLKAFMTDQCQVFAEIPKEVLLEQRYLKFRKMGRVLQAGEGE